MFPSPLNRQSIFAGASALALAFLASAGFAQDTPDDAPVDEAVVIDEQIEPIYDEVVVVEEETVWNGDEGQIIDEEPGWIDDPIEWIDEEPGVIEDGEEFVGDEDIPVYEEYPVIDGEIILVPDPDDTGADCGGCEVFTMGGGAGAVDQVSSGGSNRISVAPQTIDMCLTEAWKNLWLCRIQAGAADQ